MGLPCKIISVAVLHLHASLAEGLCQRIMHSIIVTYEDHLEVVVIPTPMNGISALQLIFL